MLRFRITAAAYAAMLLVCYATYFRPFGNALDVFGVLFCMLILACIALWPADDADPRPAGRTWADRVDMPETARGPAAGRAA